MKERTRAGAFEWFGIGLVAMSGGCSLIIGINGDFHEKASGGTTSATGSTGTTTTGTGTMSTSATMGTTSSTGTPCTTPALATSEDIVPPLKMMGLNLAGMSGHGITYQEAAALNCDGTPTMGSQFLGGTGVTWGSMQQSVFYYDVATGRVENVQMNAGYTGKLKWSWNDANGTAHNYVAAIGSQLTKDNAPFVIDWSQPQPQLEAVVTEIYNGLVATYGTGLSPSADCVSDKTCLLSNDAMHNGVIGIRPIRFYLGFTGTNQQPAASTTSYFYAFPEHTHNDVTDPSLWTAFDTTTADPNAKSFQGATTDGTLLYFVPNPGSTLAMYDPTKPFTDTTSWTSFDLTTFDPAAKAFSGGGFDGQYVYLAPSTSGVVLRHDSQTAFGLPGALEEFNTTTLNPPASHFAGVVSSVGAAETVFIPANDGIPAIYYSGAVFTNPATSWATVDLTQFNANWKQFHGGANFKQYVYLAPHGAGSTYPGIALRCDLSQDPTQIGAWAAMDLNTVDPGLAGLMTYDGVVSDNLRYMYFIPATNGTTNGADVMRYDTKMLFTDPMAWAAFNIGTVGGAGYTTGGWDGEYLFLSGGNGDILRYDSLGSAGFTDATSWGGSFNTSSLGGKAFYGTIFDGRYMYFAPDNVPGAKMVRFDAAFPPGGINIYASPSDY